MPITLDKVHVGPLSCIYMECSKTGGGMTVEKTVTVGLVDGLHAKTAAIFVQKAGQYQSEVHLKKGSSLINGKSILGLMSIVLKQGDEVTLVAEGLMGTKH